jgi:hypothetical protein
VRRLPTPFVLEILGGMKFSPWEFGYAALGPRMMYNKTLSPPQAAGMPMVDVEAILVHQYAAENPNEDLDVDREARAGQEPPQQSSQSQLADGPVDTEVHEGQPQEA